MPWPVGAGTVRYGKRGAWCMVNGAWCLRRHITPPAPSPVLISIHRIYRALVPESESEPDPGITGAVIATGGRACKFAELSLMARRSISVRDLHPILSYRIRVLLE